VITPFALMPGVVVRSRPIGLLKMTDESGRDTKILAVPIDRLTPMYGEVRATGDLPEIVSRQIVHFFAHYKDLEPGKWVRIEGWGTPEEAQQEIRAGIERFRRGEV